MTFNYALSSLLLPPTSLIALTLLGVLMLKRRRIAGLVLIVGSQLLLLALSTPVVANAIVRTLEPPPAAIDEVKRAQAIVVLGGGRNLGSPEWGGETVNDYTLRRARYGARLARETGLPLYVSGGKPTGGESAEGTLMRGLLTSELGVPVKWVETASKRRVNKRRWRRRICGRSRSAALPWSRTPCICRVRDAHSSWLD